MTNSAVAIIGAGMAGLACARRLAEAGIPSVLFDKARGPGGRMSTRRLDLADGRSARFDHGAQYVTAKDPEFANLLETLRADGAAALYPWPVQGSRDGPEPRRYSGAEGMNAIPKALAADHRVHLQRQATGIVRYDAGWRIAFNDGATAGPFEAVVIATPAEQAVALLSDGSGPFAEVAAAARTAPCWAGMIVFDGDGGPAFGALRLEAGEDEPLAWLARTADELGWVAHASPAWSRANLELEPAAALIALEAAVRRHLPGAGAVVAAQAHRWRYAQVDRAAGVSHLWDAGRGLGLCGDWLLGPRVELAWRSGDALGAAIAEAR